jgi:hypothetical protein
VLSGLGSGWAWLRHFLRRDEREEDIVQRNKILDLIARARVAETPEELLAMEREVDAIVRETLNCYDDGAIEEEDLSAFDLALAQFHYADADRRAAIGMSPPEAARMRAR